MDYYFSAANDAVALRAKDLPGGPMPGSEGFDSVETKDVLGTALEELAALASGKDNAFSVARTLPLWPEMPANLEDYEPGSFLTRLPDTLRDDLAELQVTSTLAAQWSDELFGYDPEGAERAANAIVALARAARDGHRSIYWWSEL